MGALAIALLIAAFTDLRRREIDNWLNAAIVAAAPVFWWASGLSLWPDVGFQFGIAIITFVVTAGLFALRAMGGGDVKLLTALALWIRPEHFLFLVVVMAMLGGILTLLFGAWHVARRRPAHARRQKPAAAFRSNIRVNRFLTISIHSPALIREFLRGAC